MNSSHHAIVALLLAIVALTGCPRPRKQCLAGQDYFADFDDCLWRCNDPATPPGERCVESDGGVRESGVGRSDASDVVNDMTAAPADSAVDVTMGDIATDGDASEGVAAPRQVFPLSLVMLSGNQPTLKWALANGTDGASIELCRDRALTAECQRWSAAGSESRVPMALARGPWFWRLRGRAGMRDGSATSAIWYFWSSGRASARDATYAQIPDVNGDGLADVIFNEQDRRDPPASDGGVSDGGAWAPPRLVVYSGSRSGLSTPQFISIPGYWPYFTGAGFVSDVNGDGYGDVVAPVFPEGNITFEDLRIAVLLGSSAGVNSTPQLLAAPDVQFAAFGFMQLPIGDADGDGRIEVALCSPGDFREGRARARGRCHIYSGSDGGLMSRPRATLLAPMFAPFPTFASILWPAPSSQGDIDGDGLADLSLASAEFVDMASTAVEGRTFLFRGSRSGLAPNPTQTIIASDRGGWGYDSSIIGDQDGDGDLELITSSVGGTSPSLFVFRGANDGLTLPPSDVRASTTTQLNRTWRAIGDVNGDGLGDANMSWDEIRGSEFFSHSSIIVGTTTGLSPTRIDLPPLVSAGLGGATLDGLGDIDGDLRFDVLDRRDGRVCFGHPTAAPDRCIPVVQRSGTIARILLRPMF
jgi:hypothetical protein